MADLLFIAAMFGFFGLCVLLVRVCDRIIGVDDEVVVGLPPADDEVRAA